MRLPRHQDWFKHHRNSEYFPRVVLDRSRKRRGLRTYDLGPAQAVRRQKRYLAVYDLKVRSGWESLD